jgi:hypothetical protein
MEVFRMAGAERQQDRLFGYWAMTTSAVRPAPFRELSAGAAGANSQEQMVASIFSDRLKAVDAAIKAADPEQFIATYKEMTTACNACHAGMEHPFLVIKVPDAMNYPDQEFRP